MNQKLKLLFSAISLSLMMISTTYGEEQNVKKYSLRCTQEELMQFFPTKIVESILIQSNIPKEKAELIATTLSQKEKELSKIMESRSDKSIQSSFDIASQRENAAKIYHESLYEVFSKVMKENGITDSNQIKHLLDELQETRSQLFLECIRSENSKNLFSPQNPSNFF